MLILVNDVRILHKLLESDVNHCKLGHLFRTSNWKLHNFGQRSRDNFESKVVTLTLCDINVCVNSDDWQAR